MQGPFIANLDYPKSDFRAVNEDRVPGDDITITTVKREIPELDVLTRHWRKGISVIEAKEKGQIEEGTAIAYFDNGRALCAAFYGTQNFYGKTTKQEDFGFWAIMPDVERPFLYQERFFGKNSERPQHDCTNYSVVMLGI
jgi:hypothetical protein